MRRPSWRVYATIGGALVGAAVLTAAVVARPDGSPQPSRPVGHHGPGARSLLSILERSPRPDDAVPASLAEGPLLSDGVANLGGARRAPDFARPTWIAPSADGEAVCVVSAGALACPSTTAIRERGAAVGLFKSVDTPWRVLGLAADGVSAVTVVRADGSTTQVDVRANFFAYEDAAPPRELRWRGPKGEQLWRRGRISWPGAAPAGL
jgi:hypothetical protein